MKKFRVGALTCALGAVMALSACGGEHTQIVTVTKTKTVQQAATSNSADEARRTFINQGDALCAKYNARLEPIIGRMDDISEAPEVFTSSEQQFERLAFEINKVGDLVQSFLDEFRTLTPPPTSRNVIATYIKSIDRYPTIYENMAAAAVALDNHDIDHDSNTIKRLSTYARGLAVGYGFHVCGHRPPLAGHHASAKLF